MELLRDWYGRRMNAWELDLATRSTDRVVRPFDWGLEWTANWVIHSVLPEPEAFRQRGFADRVGATARFPGRDSGPATA